jgi:CBS domain-containing protein
MNVASILHQKGRAVTTVSPSATLLDVATKLAAKRIGAVVVVESGGRLGGIISERDIIRALAKNGQDCMSRPVSEVMTRDVVTCQEADTLDELMAMMTSSDPTIRREATSRRMSSISRLAAVMPH